VKRQWDKRNSLKTWEKIGKEHNSNQERKVKAQKRITKSTKKKIKGGS